MNPILDKAYKVTEANGIGAGIAVVRGANDGECALPAVANAEGFLGFTTHAQARVGRFVTVRRAGIALARAAGAIARGARVCIANAAGHVDAITNPTYSTGIVGSNNALTFEWKDPRFCANMTLNLLNAGASQTFGWSFLDGDLRLRLTTNGASAITMTAAQLRAAIAADAELSRLLVASNTGASNGTGTLSAEIVSATNLSKGLNPIGTAEQAAAEDGDLIEVFVG